MCAGDKAITEIFFVSAPKRKLVDNSSARIVLIDHRFITIAT